MKVTLPLIKAIASIAAVALFVLVNLAATFAMVITRDPTVTGLAVSHKLGNLLFAFGAIAVAIVRRNIAWLLLAAGLQMLTIIWFFDYLNRVSASNAG